MSSHTDILSDDWRVNRSTNQDIELANSLRHARTIVDTIYGSQGEVKVSLATGKTSQTVRDRFSNEFEVILNAGTILGKYPIPGQNLDAFCGHAIHESLHMVYKSHNVLGTPEPLWRIVVIKPPTNVRFGPSLGLYLTQEEADKWEIPLRDYIGKCWKKYIEIAEEVFVDNARPGIVNEYISRARQQQVQKLGENIPWDNLWNLWVYLSVYRQPPDFSQIDPELIGILQYLLATTAKMTPHSVHNPQGYQPMNTSNQVYIMDDSDYASYRQHTCAQIWPALWQMLVKYWLEQQEEESENGSEGEPTSSQSTDPGDSNEQDNKTEPDEPESGDQTMGDGEGEDGEQEEDEIDDNDTDTENETDAGDDHNDTDTDGYDDELDEEDDGDSDSTSASISIDPLAPPNTDILHSQGEPQTITDKHMELLEEYIEQGVEDISQSLLDDINEALPGKGAAELRGNEAIIFKDSSAPMVKNFSDKLSRDLAWIRNFQISQGYTVYRPESAGRVAQRHLHRAFVDGNIFQYKVRKPRRDVKIVILMDRSGSMRNSEEIYDIPYAIGNIWHNVPIYSYDSGFETIEITNHRVKGGITEISARGGTPSAEAIMAIAQRYPTHTMLHFTDGQPSGTSLLNSTWTNFMTDIFEVLSIKYPLVKVINVIYQYNARLYTNNLSNNSYILIDSVEEFAKLSRQLLTDTIMEMD